MIKFLLSLLFALVVIIKLPASELDYQVHPQESKALSLAIQILSSSHSSKGNEVWPAYDLTEGPVLITFGNGHVYALNLKSHDPAWKKLTINGTEVLFSETDKWGATRSTFNPRFPIEGKSAYVFNLDQALSDPQQTFLIFVHERFHTHEFAHFHHRASSANYVDNYNAENLALSRMEEMALNKFLNAKEPLKKMEYLKDFLAAHLTRRALIHPHSARWEDHQQLMEGLADYASIKMFDVFPLLRGFNGSRHIAEILQRGKDDRDFTDYVIKWRHYGVGAALGYALDFVKAPQWKDRVERRGNSLALMLANAIPMSSEEVAARLQEIQATYDWDDVFSDALVSIQTFQDEMDQIMKSYKELEGIIIKVGRPRAGLSGSGSNSQMFYLADGSTLSLNDNLRSSSSDNHWKLQLDDMPYVFKQGNGSIEFKIELEITITIDNHSYTYKELISHPKKIRFTTIVLKGQACQFTSEHNEGTLTILPDGKIEISFI